MIQVLHYDVFSVVFAFHPTLVLPAFSVQRCYQAALIVQSFPDNQMPAPLLRYRGQKQGYRILSIETAAPDVNLQRLRPVMWRAILWDYGQEGIAMKFYLSSFKLGNSPEDLVSMLAPDNKIGYVPSACDYTKK